jgi:L-asparagine oxygenase
MCAPQSSSEFCLAETNKCSPSAVAANAHNAFPLGKEPLPTLSRPLKPLVVFVTTRERAMLHKHAQRLVLKFGTYEHPRFLDDLTYYANKYLPVRLRRILSHFICDFGFHQFGAIVFQNLMSVEQKALGRTPESYHHVDPARVAVYGFISVLLHGGLNALVIAQSCQRNGLEGGLLHHVIPVAEKKDEAIGEGFGVDLWCHTEESNLYTAAHFMTLSFLRNYERTPSMLYSIRSHDLTLPYVEDLFKPNFYFANDPNGVVQDRFSGAIPEAVLWGNRWLPFMRMDPQEQLRAEANQPPAARRALETFWHDAQNLIYKDFRPQAGDVILINNALCAHGRSSFQAGITVENGRAVECERRWMMRVMSLDSRIGSFPYRHDVHAHLVTERQFGSLL